MGMEKMLAHVKEKFYWLGHHKDTQNWCRNCATCSTRKNPPQKPLQSIRTGYPLQMVATDILGPFPESKTGNKSLSILCMGLLQKPQIYNYATQLQQQLQTAYEFVREKIRQKFERQKEFYDRKVHGKPFSIGDLIH